MKNKIYGMLAAGTVLLLASCSLHDDTEVFGEPAAQRLEESVTADKALLESASNGWELHLWTGQDYSYGGFTYFLKFSNDKVTVQGDVSSKIRLDDGTYATPDYSTSSSYDIISDEGPVLTINTFNEILHFLATPSMANDEGWQQDYEFAITRVTNDSIYLRGKKWGNHMVMTRVADDVNWTSEVSQMVDMDHHMYWTYDVRQGADSIGNVVLNGNRVLTLTTADSTQTRPFYYSTDGIVLQRPVIIGGVQMQHFVYNTTDSVLTCSDAGATGYTMPLHLVDGFMEYDDYAGNWQFDFYYSGYGFGNVTITPDGNYTSLTMSGLGDGINVQLIYDKTDGSIQIPAQSVETLSDGTYIYLASWNLNGSGSLTWSSSTGMKFLHDPSLSGTYLVASSIDPLAFSTDSFILWGYNGGSLGRGSNLGVTFAWGNDMMPYIDGLRKR